MTAAENCSFDLPVNGDVRAGRDLGVEEEVHVGQELLVVEGRYELRWEVFFGAFVHDHQESCEIFLDFGYWTEDQSS